MIVGALTLLARILLAIGPDGTVLCVHKDGGVFVEATTQLCCKRSECLDGRAVAGEQDPEAPDDDCHDYALSTGEPIVMPDGAPPLDMKPSVLLSCALPRVEHLAQHLLEHPARRFEQEDPPDIPAGRDTVLRC